MQTKTHVSILYSNTPNPIVRERIEALSQSGKFSVVIYYIERQASSLTLKFERAEATYHRIQMSDERGLSVMRGINICKLAWLLRKQDGVLYTIYPDMLAAAILSNIFSCKRRKIFHEIQDLHSSALLFRFIHSVLLCCCRKIFITSPYYTNEPIWPFLFLRKRTTYISNSPSRSSFSRLARSFEQSLKTFEKGEVNIGFIGNLRDKEQLSHMRWILENTEFKVTQAGASDFTTEMNDLRREFEGRITFTGRFEAADLGRVYACINLVWCAYPPTYNYRFHMARRLHEASFLGIPVVVSGDAEGNRRFCKKYDVPALWWSHDILDTDGFSRQAEKLVQSEEKSRFVERETYDDFVEAQITELLNG